VALIGYFPILYTTQREQRVGVNVQRGGRNHSPVRLGKLFCGTRLASASARFRMGYKGPVYIGPEIAHFSPARAGLRSASTSNPAAQLLPISSPEQLLPISSPEQLLPISSPEQLLPIRSPEQLLPIRSPEQLLPISSPEQLLPIRSPEQLLPISSPEQLLPSRSPEQLLPIRSPEPHARRRVARKRAGFFDSGSGATRAGARGSRRSHLLARVVRLPDGAHGGGVHHDPLALVVLLHLRQLLIRRVLR
jgi:hypothetical protein